MNTSSIRTIFPKRLAHYMSEYGKTRNDLVRDLGFKYSTIRDWEKGLTVPRMDKVELLANYFHCNNSDLLEEKMQPEDKKNSDAIIDITNRLFSDNHFLSVVDSLHKLKPDQFNRASGLLDLFFKEAFNEI